MEQLKLNNKYSGFKLVKTERLKELNAKAYIFEHIKTGARLLNIRNNDDELCFGIGFRTPVENDTGLPHILEHSVLNGSKNFPTKDPFAELCRSSIQTFLNAFTFPDKTVYPFATQNKKEFKKIMNIYLDAVFNPLIYKHKEIFLQEGWRYELKDKKDKIKINGVVYGEMKGAYSSAQRILETARLKYLFPDNCYHFDSGGDPRKIPDLTYEQFIGFHKKYYHPTNSYIYIYGKDDILEHLDFIDKEYLSKYEKIEIDSKIKYQKHIEQPIEKEIYYPIAKGESPKNKTFLEISFLIEKCKDYKSNLGFEILREILMGMAASPLKKAILDAKMGENIDDNFEHELNTSTYNITLQNTQVGKKKEFYNIFENTLKKLVNNKIPKDLIKAAINKIEFELREGVDNLHGLPEGIKCFTESLVTWLHDISPLTRLKYEKILDEIKQESQSGYFENLIKKYLLNNTQKLLLTLRPDSDINLEKEVEDKLKKYKETLSTKQIDTLISDTQKIENYQNREEKKKDVETIKILPIKEIELLPKKIQIENKKVLENCELLYHQGETKGITYLNLFFELPKIDEKKVGYLGLLCILLTEAKTKNYNFEEFSNLINIYTGDITFQVRNLIHDKTQKLIPKFCIFSKALNINLSKLIDILNELFNNVIFDEKKIKEIIDRIKSQMEMNILERGHGYAYSRINSYSSENGMFSELLGGISYYDFIKNLSSDFENKKNEILKDINEIYNLVFNKQNLVLNLISEEDTSFELENLDIKTNETKKEEFHFETQKLNEGILTSTNIQYVGKGYNFRELGYKPSGSLIVLSNFLRYKYLWENLRVKGGAYGAIPAIMRTGEFVLISYRDPRLKETLKDYDNLPSFLENLRLDQKELNKYIIGAVSDLDYPLKPKDAGLKTAFEYIRGVSYEDICKEREEVLNTDVQTFRDFSKMAKDVLDKNYICVIGNENVIKENKDVFDNIRKL